MSEQEMQFADPEWQPPEDGMVQARPEAPEPFVPQPINRAPRESAMWQTGASAPPSDAPPILIQPEPYAGGYAPQQAGGSQYGRPRRKSRNPWFLIIAIIIGFSLLNGAFNSHHSTYQFPSIGSHAAPQLFVVGTTSIPTIVIQGQSGHIHINRGLDSDKVTVDVSNKGAVQYAKGSNQLTVNMDATSNPSDDLTVTVPGNANLQINTQSGDIDVQGVTGQMALVSNSGAITVNQSTLKGQSILHSDGPVTFNGSLDSSGSYQFESTGDDVDVTLPANASFHVDASTNTGSINSDFQVQPINSSGTQMHGDVGNQPGPTITLTTNGGDIHLHQPS